MDLSKQYKPKQHLPKLKTPKNNTNGKNNPPTEATQHLKPQNPQLEQKPTIYFNSKGESRSM